MSKVTCTRRIQFAAGHRVWKHESCCAQIHGHNYFVYITASAENLDPIGRVIDFSVLKEKVGGWIDKNWDHGFIVFSGDLPVKQALAVFSDGAIQQKIYEMPCNPTAENIAIHLLRVVCPEVLKDTGVVVTKVVVEETENCKATVEL